jgi:hypothetical protein
MTFHWAFGFGLGLALAFIGLAYLRNRRLRNRRGERPRSRFRGGSAGNALHQLRAYVHPHTKFAIAQMQKEAVIENDSLDRQDPVAHLYGQAIKIQKGEEVERITALAADEQSRK